MMAAKLLSLSSNEISSREEAKAMKSNDMIEHHGSNLSWRDTTNRTRKFANRYFDYFEMLQTWMGKISI